MAEIRTVLGPIATNDLGITLPHEHIAWNAYKRPAGSEGYNWSEVIQVAGDELAKLRIAGVQALVELTTMGNERNPQALVEISRRSGLHIVAATGFWCDPPLHNLVGTDDVDALVDFMTREIEQGMDGTSIRAGIIKVATSAEMTPAERAVLRAAARASRRTGAAITTHTDMGRLALEQLDLLALEGADLTRVVVGHLGGKPDLDLHLEVARRGAYLGYDRVGKLHRQSDDICAELIATLARRGYLDRVTVSHDTGVFMWGRYMPPLPPNQPARSMEERPAYTYILETFIPQLRQVGLSEEAIHTIVVENPAYILAM